MARQKRVPDSKKETKAGHDVPYRKYEKFAGFATQVDMVLETIKDVCLDLASRELLYLPKWYGLEAGKDWTAYDPENAEEGSRAEKLLSVLRSLSETHYPQVARLFWEVADSFLSSSATKSDRRVTKLEKLEVCCRGVAEVHVILL